MKKFLLPLLAFLLLLFPTVAFAHPGRTAADGCHYCRTNCDRWGVPWNERHCHGGRSSIKPILGVKECKADNLWAFLAPGKQECGYEFWDWVTGWGLVYGVAGFFLYSWTKENK